MLIYWAVKHEGQATGEEPLCVSVAPQIETGAKHRQQSTVADTGYQTNGTEKMSAKETASGEKHRMKEKGGEQSDSERR